MMGNHDDKVAFYCSLLLNTLSLTMTYIKGGYESPDTHDLQRDCFEQFAKEHPAEAVELCYRHAQDILEMAQIKHTIEEAEKKAAAQ